MSDSTSQYPTGVYVKGDKQRVARRASQAVALVFQGYVLKKEQSADTTEVETPEVDPAAEEMVAEGAPAFVPTPRPSRARGDKQ